MRNTGNGLLYKNLSKKLNDVTRRWRQLGYFERKIEKPLHMEAQRHAAKPIGSGACAPALCLCVEGFYSPQQACLQSSGAPRNWLTSCALTAPAWLPQL